MVDHPALNLFSLDAFLPSPLSDVSVAFMYSSALSSVLAFLVEVTQFNIFISDLETLSD